MRGDCISRWRSSASKFTSWAIAQGEYGTMIKKKLLYSPGCRCDTGLSLRLAAAFYQQGSFVSANFSLSENTCDAVPADKRGWGEKAALQNAAGDKLEKSLNTMLGGLIGSLAANSPSNNGV